ncbi:hypothetical protein SS50377_28524 [Spironucleus salmonicida]|uniref:Uncharacterized protein n=2 Tax=Spironucleus salmonicida TaxID=348837 RepID=V6LE73_9EUKA|nr:hypothetical protein SS50377_28524 [Spironucleus salmonicida]|eukprot:EST42772.1 Hypothetical protein SS50377_17640 [Spironucleus salmonicida]
MQLKIQQQYPPTALIRNATPAIHSLTLCQPEFIAQQLFHPARFAFNQAGANGQMRVLRSRRANIYPLQESFHSLTRSTLPSRQTENLLSSRLELAAICRFCAASIPRVPAMREIVKIANLHFQALNPRSRQIYNFRPPQLCQIKILNEDICTAKEWGQAVLSWKSAAMQLQEGILRPVRFGGLVIPERYAREINGKGAAAVVAAVPSEVCIAVRFLVRYFGRAAGKVPVLHSVLASRGGKSI